MRWCMSGAGAVPEFGPRYLVSKNQKGAGYGCEDEDGGNICHFIVK